MRNLIWALIVVLVVLHQDNWFWDDATLVGGFMPITLLYHAGISVVAAVLWYLATIFCWPRGLDVEGDGPVSTGQAGAAAGRGEAAA